MQELNLLDVENVSGGMRWEGDEMSANVIDCQNGWYCTNAGSGDIEWGQTLTMWGF